MDEQPSIYNHCFYYTPHRLPSDGCFLFVAHGAPDAQTIQYRLIREKDRGILSTRTLITDHLGKLGLFIGNVTLREEDGLKIINVADNCEKQWSLAGLLQVDKKVKINIATLLKPKQFRGTTKVMINDETVFAYLKKR